MKPLEDEVGATRTVCVARPAPPVNQWADFVHEALLTGLADRLPAAFHTGDTHIQGLFAQGTRALCKGEREFSLWCDIPGELIPAHEDLRAQQADVVSSTIAAVWTAHFSSQGSRDSHLDEPASADGRVAPADSSG